MNAKNSSIFIQVQKYLKFIGRKVTHTVVEIEKENDNLVVT